MHECTTVERHKRIKEKRQYTTHSSCSCTVLRSTCRVVHRYTYSCVNKIMIIDILKRCILYMNYDHRSSRTATNQHPTTSAWYMPHIVLGDRSQVKPENNPTENSRSICDGPISVPLYTGCTARVLHGVARVAVGRSVSQQRGGRRRRPHIGSRTLTGSSLHRHQMICSALQGQL